MSTSLGNRYSQHSFARVPTANTPRSKFDRSFAAKDTVKFDLLTPIFIDEILPGDTINLNVKTFMRLAPQIRPIMDNMMVDFYFFFCPNRLVFNDWQKLMGEQENPGDSIDYLTPVLATDNTTNFQVGSIYDKFGLPTDVSGWGSSIKINALPFRMYNLIWNQWFRDQNLQSSLTVNKGVGPDLINFTLQKGNKKHDYFTSALPFQQKGLPGAVPIQGTAPVYGNGRQVRMSPTSGITAARDISLNGVGSSVGAGGLQYSGSPTATTQLAYFPQSTEPASPGPILQAEFATSDVRMLISEFRQTMQVQSFFEQDARGGTRYTEILKSHFNVISPDARLQRSEFLSATTVNITQHPIAQTSESNDTPQGNLAAFSTLSSMGNQIGFNKSFLEHGFVIGLMKPRADVTYQQGLNRMWNRRTRFDYFWPKFQELSEQPVFSSEIFLGPSGGDLFAWQERYAEMRYRPSEIRGQFRSTYALSLDVWHQAEEFGSAPSLNSTFIASNTPIARALTVPDPTYPDLLCDFWFDYKHIRPMVTYPVPISLGRF